MQSTPNSVWVYSKNLASGSDLFPEMRALVMLCVFECPYLSILLLLQHEWEVQGRCNKHYFLNVPKPILTLCCPFSSVTAKIKAIEAKLKMMAENPDAEYPAAPVYSYFKPPDKKRTTPYSRTAWKSRRWWLWITVAAKANWSPHLKPSAFVLCRCDWYSPAEHNPMLEFGKKTFLAVPMDVSTLKYVWNWASSRINRILSKIVIWTLGCSSWLVCLDL